MIKFNNNEDESAVGIYTAATRLSPISKTKKEKVLKDYGIKTGWTKGKSDTAISKAAADAVLKKWKADQAKAKADAKKAADAKNPPAKTPTKVTQPAAKTLSRAEAAALSRKYGFDPAKLFGYGVKGGSYWVTSSSAAYVWKDAASFEAWLKRLTRASNASAYR